VNGGYLEDIRIRIEKREYYFTLHAADRMIERHISVREVEEAMLSDLAVVIEDYPEDVRGSSCLVLGMAKSGRPLHIQITYPLEIAVVTVYEPRAEEWIDWRKRVGGIR